MSERADALTAILNQIGADGGGDSAVARVLPYVYDELRSLADGYLRGERPDHTLQATALVHEAYMRMAGAGGREWTDRKHFFRLAAKTMRHILVDHGRARAAEKRGGRAAAEALTETALALDTRHAEILEIDDALEQLFTLSPEKARVVELRFYGGCTIEETAEALGISTATVERDWRFARAWLKAKLSGDKHG
jgi:RNA polymerase sigma factor (TIGR02999 family)